MSRRLLFCAKKDRAEVCVYVCVRVLIAMISMLISFLSCNLCSYLNTGARLGFRP